MQIMLPMLMLAGAALLVNFVATRSIFVPSEMRKDEKRDPTSSITRICDFEIF